MNFKLRRAIERSIIRCIVRDVLAAGHEISVYDGEEVTLTSSRDQRAIMAALFTTDEDRLLIHRSGEPQRFGWVYLVYGNDGWDVVNDYTTNLESLLKGANTIADRAEERYG